MKEVFTKTSIRAYPGRWHGFPAEFRIYLGSFRFPGGAVAWEKVSVLAGAYNANHTCHSC
jgi:hypothetical protein